MVVLLLVLFMVFLIIGLCKDWDDDFCCGLLFMFLICLIIAAVLGGFIINGRTLTAKIEMYTEENKRIEENINNLVEQYMNYESGIYGELKNESSITLVSLYPELKADSLVTNQIEVYTSNNEQIKELKEKQINISNYKWWLYFGG